MNFRQIMALRPLNDKKFILGNKNYDEVVEVAALRKVELDRFQKEFLQLLKKNIMNFKNLIMCIGI